MYLLEFNDEKYWKPISNQLLKWGNPIEERKNTISMLVGTNESLMLS